MFELITPENFAELLKQGRELDTLTGGAISNTIRSFGANLSNKWVAAKQNRLAQNTAEKLDQLGGMHNEGPDTALLEPALQAALYEGREELSELWSTLIAKIMNRRENRIRLSFIETLKRFDPEDALVLQHHNTEAYKSLMDPLTKDHLYSAGRSTMEVQAERDYFNQVGLSADDLAISKDHLAELKCLSLTALRRAVLTPYGRALSAAVTMPLET